jgi:hypothetical protein
VILSVVLLLATAVAPGKVNDLTRCVRAIRKHRTAAK